MGLFVRAVLKMQAKRTEWFRRLIECSILFRCGILFNEAQWMKRLIRRVWAGWQAVFPQQGLGNKEVDAPWASL